MVGVFPLRSTPFAVELQVAWTRRRYPRHLPHVHWFAVSAGAFVGSIPTSILFPCAALSRARLFCGGRNLLEAF